MPFRLQFDPPSADLAAARACEQAVFLQAYGNSAEEWAEEYGPYENASKFLTVSEPGGDVVAACRFILPSPVGLKTLVDTARPPWFLDGERAARAAQLDLDRTWDVATIAVRKGAGKAGLLATTLYHGLYRATRVNDVRSLVMIMDTRARRLLDLVSLETNVFPSARPGAYLGSAASVPLWVDMASMVDRQRRIAPESYRLVGLAVGLDGVIIPGDDGFRLRRPDRVEHAISTRIGEMGPVLTE